MRPLHTKWSEAHETFLRLCTPNKEFSLHGRNHSRFFAIPQKHYCLLQWKYPRLPKYGSDLGILYLKHGKSCKQSIEDMTFTFDLFIEEWGSKSNLAADLRLPQEFWYKQFLRLMWPTCIKGLQMYKAITIAATAITMYTNHSLIDRRIYRPIFVMYTMCYSTLRQMRSTWNCGAENLH